MVRFTAEDDIAYRMQERYPTVFPDRRTWNNFRRLTQRVNGHLIWNGFWLRHKGGVTLTPYVHRKNRGEPDAYKQQRSLWRILWEDHHRKKLGLGWTAAPGCGEGRCVDPRHLVKVQLHGRAGSIASTISNGHATLATHNQLVQTREC